MTDYYLAPLPTAIAVLIAALVSMELGRVIGRNHQRRFGGRAKGLGTAGGAVFATLGLIMAFTFSNAADKFEDRRDLIADEANAIGTAWMRLDMLPKETQPRARELFLAYVDARLAIYAAIPDMDAVKRRLAESFDRQQQLWYAASAGVQMTSAPTGAAEVLLPAVNQMFDVATLRLVATQKHPPIVIFLLLAMLALMSGLLSGYESVSSPERRWLLDGGFALLLAFVMFVILELEYPRRGFIRIDSADQLLLDLRANMQ